MKKGIDGLDYLSHSNFFGFCELAFTQSKNDLYGLDR